MLHQLPDGPVAARRGASQLGGLDAAHDPVGDVASALEHVDIEWCCHRSTFLLASSLSRQTAHPVPLCEQTYGFCARAGRPPSACSSEPEGSWGPAALARHPPENSPRPAYQMRPSYPQRIARRQAGRGARAREGSWHRARKSSLGRGLLVGDIRGQHGNTMIPADQGERHPGVVYSGAALDFARRRLEPCCPPGVISASQCPVAGSNRASTCHCSTGSRSASVAVPCQLLTCWALELVALLPLRWVLKALARRRPVGLVARCRSAPAAL